MRRAELEDYEIMRAFVAGFISRKDAAQKLSLTERSNLCWEKSISD
jgi:hypothetical protein